VLGPLSRVRYYPERVVKPCKQADMKMGMATRHTPDKAL